MKKVAEVECGFGPPRKKDVPREFFWGCGKKFPWITMFRCLDCGTWFCRHCMEEHIGRNSLKNREVVECWDCLNRAKIEKSAVDEGSEGWIKRLKESGWEVG